MEALFKNFSFLMTMSLMRKLRKLMKFLKFRTLHDRRLCLDALFFIPAYSGLKCFHVSLVYLFIRSVTYVTLDTSITDYNLQHIL